MKYIVEYNKFIFENEDLTGEFANDDEKAAYKQFLKDESLPDEEWNQLAYDRFMKNRKRFIKKEPIAMTKADFLSIAKTKWADLYKYNHANFTSMNTPIRIECKKHGPFNLTPLEHIKGKGCPECSGSKGFDRTVNQQGYLPDTAPAESSQQDMTGISSSNKNKERENKPYHGNRQKPGRKLVHHKTGGGRSRL